MTGIPVGERQSSVRLAESNATTVNNMRTSPDTELRRNARRRVWLFMGDGRNTQDMRDLAHVDAILWGSNPYSRRGDLALMYRTAPYSDIAYLFRVASDPRPKCRDDQADTTHVVELAEKIALATPISFEALRSESALRKWPFSRFPRGQMRRRDDLVAEGVWPELSALIRRHNPRLDLRRLGEGAAFDDASAFRWDKLRIFLSYAHIDGPRVQRIYDSLRRLRGVDVWRDDTRLHAGVQWEKMIERAIEVSDVVVICLSRRALRPRRYLHREIALALRAVDRRAGNVSIIPVKLEACQPQPRLRRWQWVSMADRGGSEYLVDAIRMRVRRRAAPN